MKKGILALSLCLAGCSTGPAFDPTLPIGSPSMFNADPDRYDQKQIYVRGILATDGHWWQFNFYEKNKQYIANFCLNLEHIDWLADHRVAMNGKHVVLKGKFAKGAWSDALGGCSRNDNGLFIDEEFLRRRYRYFGR